MLISINGKIIKGTKSEFDFTDKSISYAYGVFETMRTYDQKVFRFDEHLARLFNSAEIIGLMSKFQKKDVELFMEEILLKYSKGFNTEARIKITLTENYCIIYFSQNVFDVSIYGGVKAIAFKGERFLPEAKTLNGLVSFLANETVKKKGCFEAVLVNQKGFVTEGAYSNIFWIEGGILYTTNEGILDGITRMTVLESLKNGKIKGLKSIFDNNKTIESLQKVDEIFMTQSSKGIVPIINLDGKRIGDGKVGNFTKELMKMFSI